MKILVIQLTRLGDILCTLPTLTALRRESPDAQIHFLVGKSFAEAASLGNAADHIWNLDSEELLAPIISSNGEYESSLNFLSRFIGKMRAEKFDKIVNLSFSPSSSYITHLISQDKIPTVGFTRTSDFYLHVPDEASRYFRAQVGLDRANRIHVVDLMAWVAGVGLLPHDIRFLGNEKSSGEKTGIVCHLGASDRRKTWPPEYWITLIRQMIEDLNLNITLIGGKKEIVLGNSILKEDDFQGRLQNKIGNLSLRDLAQVLSQSRLFIGADSGPLHMASLANCQTLNLSVGNVKFWESGPLTLGSRVLAKKEPLYLTPDSVFDEVEKIISGKSSQLAESISPTESVRFTDNEVGQSTWDLIRWIYFKGPRPEINTLEISALTQCVEICNIAMTQAEALFKDPTKIEITGILDRLDQVLDVLRTGVPKISPLINYFFSEKESIPPGLREQVFYQTDLCYRNLKTFCLSLNPKTNFVEKGWSL